MVFLIIGIFSYLEKEASLSLALEADKQILLVFKTKVPGSYFDILKRRHLSQDHVGLALDSRLTEEGSSFEKHCSVISLWYSSCFTGVRAL